MKFKIVIVVLFYILTSVFPTVKAQNKNTKNKTFHLVYIETSKTRNKIGTAEAVSKLVKEFKTSQDSFLIFISNRDKTELINDPSKINYISRLINNQNIAPPSARVDREKILSYLDLHDIVYQTKDNRMHLKYRFLKIHIFQSNTFMNLFADQLIYRLLKIKNISKSDGNNSKVKLKFYLDKSSRDFNDNENYITQISKYEKSYTHDFIKY